MTRKTLLILLAVILVAGCRGGLFGTQGAEPIDIHRGTQGITVEFLENSPPQSVIENSAFTTSVEIENAGASHVDEGFIGIVVENAFVALDGDQIRKFDLEGKVFGIPQGESKIETFHLNSRQLSRGQNSVATNIALNVCYPYKTEAELSICVDTDVFGQSVAQKSCEPRAVGLGGGQGAPVAVTRVSPQYSLARGGERIDAAYTIEIANAGNGRAYDSFRSFEACTPQSLSSRPGEQVWNIAAVRAWLGDVELDCTPKKRGTSGKEGLANFDKGRAEVVCKMTEGIQTTTGTYIGTMRIELDYGYTFTVARRLQINSIS